MGAGERAARAALGPRPSALGIQRAPGTRPWVLGEALGEELERVAHRVRAVTAHLSTRSRGGREMGNGAGVVWRSDGLIVTNAHVARGHRVRVALEDGREWDGEVTARDEQRDLAAVRVDGDVLRAADPADPARLRAGQVVLAVGSPLGVVGALSVGVLHAAPRAASDPWVRADVRLLPGNSGGPLADTSGRVIGINSMVVNGLGHAVPIAAVERFLRAPEARPRLGVTARPVRVRRGRDGEEMAGLMLLELEPEGAAALGGLLPGDVVVGANGRELRLPGDLSGALYGASPGEAVFLDVVRGGRVETHPVTPAGEAGRGRPNGDRAA